MQIKVVLADDSEVMRAAMRQNLAQERRISIVGEAPNFVATMQMIDDFKPDVLILDLHMPESGDFTPQFVKSQIACVPHTLAVSLANDDEARALAESYGAEALLDKMNLYSELVPTIMLCVSDRHSQKDRDMPNTVQ
jgi:DNA-binding NarL/FixJ family response regulator